MTQQQRDYSDIMLEIGNPKNLGQESARKAAEGCLLAAERHPAATLHIYFDGYDEDPRQIWEIPEARAQVVNFWHLLGGRIPEQRFDLDSRALIAVCLAASAGPQC
jgi:hypothetical protein